MSGPTLDLLGNTPYDRNHDNSAAAGDRKEYPPFPPSTLDLLHPPHPRLQSHPTISDSMAMTTFLLWIANYTQH